MFEKFSSFKEGWMIRVPNRVKFVRRIPAKSFVDDKAFLGINDVRSKTFEVLNCFDECIIEWFQLGWFRGGFDVCSLTLIAILSVIRDQYTEISEVVELQNSISTICYCVFIVVSLTTSIPVSDQYFLFELFYIAHRLVEQLVEYIKCLFNVLLIQTMNTYIIVISHWHLISTLAFAGKAGWLFSISIFVCDVW